MRYGAKQSTRSVRLARAMACSLLATSACLNASDPIATFDDSLAVAPADTKAIAAVAGRFSDTRTASMGFYATDLGWTFRHGDDLWVLFGDSWQGEIPDPTLFADDTIGKLSLSADGGYPNGDAVERYIASRARVPAWRSGYPPIQMAKAPNDYVTVLTTRRDGVPLSSGGGLTPITGFSNARRDEESAGAFAIFLRNDPVQCDANAQCRDGFDCDTGLGRCLIKGEITDLSRVCVLEAEASDPQCQCTAPPGATGFCQDRASSMYRADNIRARAISVAMRQEVGNANRDAFHIFDTRPWDTHRFFNATARSISDFDERRPNGVGNDYRAADGIDPEREGVFLWGRPNFGGVGGEEGRDARLYLAWVPMPSYEADGKIDWQPRYFAGLDPSGRPTFVEREVDSVPLDLNSKVEGSQPEEHWGIVGQMSISWIPSLQRWVMFYGGDLSNFFLDAIFGPDASKVLRDPDGAIHIRYADQPWGPWSPPEQLLIAGNPATATGEYKKGGILHSPACGRDPTCAPFERGFRDIFNPFKPNEPGRLYGPNIVDEWTMERADGSVDLYWHVSTWNPYQVVLMKTTLRP